MPPEPTDRLMVKYLRPVHRRIGSSLQPFDDRTVSYP